MVCSWKIFVTLLFIVFDFTATTVLLIHGNDLHRFTSQFSQYSFTHSFVDLWFLSALRFSIIIGASLAVLLNTRNAVPRLKSSKTVILLTGGVMLVFLIVKLLVYSEDQANLKINKQPWFWGLFGWTLVALILFYADWILLSTVKPKRLHLLINAEDGTHDENEKLLSNHVGDDVYSRRDLSDRTRDRKKKKKTLNSGSLRRLLSYSKPDWILIVTAFIALLATSIGEIFLPLYTGKVIDGIVVHQSHSEFTQAIIIMSLISVGTALTAGIRGSIFMVVMARLNIRIRNLLFCAITKQEIGFFDSTKTGDITSRLTSDTTAMSDAVSLNLNVFLRSSVKLIGYLVIMFKLSWQLTIVTLIGIPLVAVVSKFYGKYYKKLSRLVQDTLAVANNVAEETVSSMKTVRSFANEANENKRYSDKLNETYKVRIKQAFAYGGYMVSSEMLELALSVLVLYYGGHLVMTDRMSAGKLISFILYNLELGDSLEAIATVYTGLMQASGAAEKVFELMDREPKINNNGTLLPGDIHGQLEFKNVTFSYPTRPETNVLKDVSFKASPGEVIALVGPSGGGKSSCVNLIEHFYETSSGCVLLDNTPIQDYDHRYLHTKIALVGQEPVLYGRSIKDNIAYGMADYNMCQVQSAAEMANAHKFISELKKGYDTETGEKGTQLSGGQKQRVAIARALIRNPSVLILDEATSALDAESEFLVQQAIYSNLRNRTVLIVAHRLSTIEKANRIVVIDKGKVVGQGTHFELLTQNGLYAQLVQRQLLGTESTTTTESSLPQLTAGPMSCVPLNPIPQSNIRHYNISDEESEISSPGGITFIVGSSI
ncbi:ABC-type oligopeptide transporter ABCB9-like [Glandiceps talaboti]